MSIDNVEQRISYIVAVVAAAYGALYLVRDIQKYKVTVTETPIKHACKAGYHLVSTLCEHTHAPSSSYWLVPCIAYFILGAAIVGFTRARKRAALIMIGFLLGLTGGIFEAGIIPAAYAAWLLLRAFRLQRYGTASFAGVSRAAREQRSGRTTPTANSTPAAKPAPPRSAPSESKRYTPKQKPRKR